MKYCLAVDVAKGKSMVGLISEDGEIIINLHEIVHTKSSLISLHNQIKSREISINDVAVIMESTSTYHYPILKFFKDQEYNTILLNPIISKEHKTNLRKTKTDRTDCLNLASIYFKGEYNKQSELPSVYVELQHISRQIHNLNEFLVRFKNRFRQLIEMVFPEYEQLFKKDALFSETALNFIIQFPHADLIVNKRSDALANALGEVHNRHANYYRRKAEKLKEAAKNSLTSVDSTSYVTLEVAQQAKLILELQKEIMILKTSLVELAKTIDIFDNIVSIDGIGEYTAALFLAEVKDPRRYKNVKKLTASCGLDPTIIQSGKSINYHGPISKRGNRLARKILFNIIQNILKTSSIGNRSLDNPILVYYKKKRSEGKHHYARIIACTTKLLRIAYTLCINNTTYSY
jgi:transposase